MKNPSQEQIKFDENILDSIVDYLVDNELAEDEEHADRLLQDHMELKDIEGEVASLASFRDGLRILFYQIKGEIKATILD